MGTLSVSIAIAFRFYFQALALDPERGTAHNQLGVWAAKGERHLDAVYHYVRR